MRGEEKLFRSRKSFSGAGIRNRAIGYRPDIPPSQDSKVYVGVVLGCEEGGGRKNTFRSRKVFSGAGIRNRAIGYRPDIPPSQDLKVYFGVVLGCEEGGGKKQLSGPEFFFQVQAFQTEL